MVGGFNHPEKFESQIGSSSQLLGKIKFMFQTTTLSTLLESSALTVADNVTPEQAGDPKP